MDIYRDANKGYLFIVETLIALLAVVTLQGFVLGKLDLLTVFLGKLKFASVTDFSLNKLPRESFIVWGLKTPREQKNVLCISLDNYQRCQPLEISNLGIFVTRITPLPHLAQSTTYLPLLALSTTPPPNTHPLSFKLCFLGNPRCINALRNGETRLKN